MAGAFLWSNRAAAATITAPAATLSTMPATNLADPQPRVRARFPGTAAGILLDFLSAATLDCVALLSTNATAAATVRWRVANGLDGTGTAVDAATVTGDSGTLPASTSAANNGNVVLLAAAPVTGRYLQIDLTDASLAAVDIGLVVAGPLWRLARSHSYGIEEGRLILDRRERNAFTGAEFPQPAVANPRSARFTLPMLTTAEARGAFRSLVAELGGAGDALWIPATTLSQAELNARSLWGAVSSAGDLAAAAQQRLNVHSRAFTISERL